MCSKTMVFYSLMQKNGHSYISAEKPDIFCVQETKCEKEKIPSDIKIDGYHTYWLSGDKDGYSGTGLYSKHEPISVTYGIGECTLQFCLVNAVSLRVNSSLQNGLLSKNKLKWGLSDMF